ncbi:glycine cleavage system H protein [Desulfoluna limicola]|uniref:Glycine cleavage system H protein n=1 Tax=Desulfoluna limicola TaxID=2810562 RepID=A0ABM7PFA0_9BACT|nr:glycine cleavage system protein H [Desulfoluna limicola]BCS95754.1 glycine cleavage system H protein [Desulfoluna limicola]
MAVVESYNVPDDLYYTQDHAWVAIEGERIRIGVTDFMQKMAGEITFIRLPRAGKDMTVGKTLISVQSGKWAGKIRVPVAGKVVDVNKELAETPGPLNSDPYGTGWVAIMEPASMADVETMLLHGEAALRFLKDEIKRNSNEE